MCGLFTYTYHEHEPNVGKYLIHLVFGYRNLIVNTLYTNLRFVCQAVGLQISGLHLSTVMMRDESPFFWFSMRLQDANLGGGRFTNRNLLFLGPEIFRAFQGVYLANHQKMDVVGIAFQAIKCVDQESTSVDGSAEWRCQRVSNGKPICKPWDRKCAATFIWSIDQNHLQAAFASLPSTIFDCHISVSIFNTHLKRNKKLRFVVREACFCHTLCEPAIGSTLWSSLPCTSRFEANAVWSV